MKHRNITHSTTILITLALLSLIAAYWGGIENLIFRWTSQEEYSHGFMIPFVAGYFAWQKRYQVIECDFQPAWSGIGLVLFGIALLVLGELSAIYILIHYSLLLVIAGLIVAAFGWRVLKIILVPLLILLFAIPLPYFIDSALSWRLQLISSELGVFVVRAFDIPVYLEGNVIDLGVYKLQVVEACSGLRYLFPLMSLGFIAAYIYKAPFWQRATVFLSTIPITILMNSFRIGVIGVLVNGWGVGMAEGFIHDFEGWIVFMACSAVLVGEIWLLTKMRQDKPQFADVFGIEIAEKGNYEAGSRAGGNKPLAVIVVLMLTSTLTVNLVAERDELKPGRQDFSSFPLEQKGWSGVTSELKPNVERKLQVDDYLLADFRKEREIPINLYLAYYASQRKGVSPHSPRVCIPGGGWRISGLDEMSIPVGDGESISVNRLIIQKNDVKQLVYYWFQQRGRKIANEYWMKWYLLWDSITMNRTDGALVRFTTFIPPGSDVAISEGKLLEFIRTVYPSLPGYIPD
ncbi:MAG: VPLPA-CTERM-specific exosortase XrtD [Candidatus Sedimenticola sp. (ex Thyasira tokunagai)]